jgi:hypothetical protein
MLVEWMPQPLPVEADAPAAPEEARPAQLADDWSNVDCCSAMRPRPQQVAEDRAERAAWPPPADPPAVEHYV